MTDERTEADIMAELEDRLDNPPSPWMPIEIEDMPEDSVRDERISGIVIQAEMRSGDWGPYPWLVVKRGDGSRVSISGFGTVLKGKLGTVAVGDGLAVKYLGTVPSKVAGQADYKNYLVEVISQGGTPPSVQPPTDLPDVEVEPGVFMSELDVETLRILAEGSGSPVEKARAQAWLERASA